MQFDTTINRWHTCKTTGRINASNPCSEYMFLDDSALQPRFPELDEVHQAGRAIRRGSLPARCRYGDARSGDPGRQTPATPTESIARKLTTSFRPLGLGFANLGAALMSLGLPYGQRGRKGLGPAPATAIMCGQAYLTSAAHRRSHRTVPRLRAERGTPSWKSSGCTAGR